MSAIIRFFRKMNVILFLSFFMFSVIFIGLIVSLDRLNWNQMFISFESKDLDQFAYLLMDDMRRENIGVGPLTSEEQEWLHRRSALYGVLVRYSSFEDREVWLNTFAKSGRAVDQEPYTEVTYINNGKTMGKIRLAYMSEREQLNPAFQSFQETIQQRSRILLTAAFLVAIGISFFVATKLSKHLTQVYEMAFEIGRGKRNVSIPIKGPEEVRKLATMLNDLTMELQRQEDWRHHLMEDFMHELRTPLTSILSQLEAMVDGVYEADTERMEGLYDELIRLSRLVNDLERLSEAEAARFTMNVKRTNMVALARHVYNNYRALAAEKRIKLEFDPTNVPCYAEVDYDKVMQVLTNVVLNAIKYTSAGGRILLRVDWNADQTIISCEDTGIGIHADDLPYIFNRLFRADKSRSRFSGGAGLGLSITKALVEAHKGTIEAISQPGVGSTFTISFNNVFEAYGEEE